VRVSIIGRRNKTIEEEITQNKTIETKSEQKKGAYVRK
jgi:hypothetical protein